MIIAQILLCPRPARADKTTQEGPLINIEAAQNRDLNSKCLSCDLTAHYDDRQVEY